MIMLFLIMKLPPINLYNIYIYNLYSNFCNLNYTYNGLKVLRNILVYLVFIF